MQWSLLGRAALPAVGLLAGLAVAAETPVAGLRPERRPSGAPRIVAFVADEAWRANAVKGLGTPATGTAFLKDQGAWYTPFNRPNMPGYYDWRGLHAAGRAGGKD